MTQKRNICINIPGHTDHNVPHPLIHQTFGYVHAFRVSARLVYHQTVQPINSYLAFGLLICVTNKAYYLFSLFSVCSVFFNYVIYMYLLYIYIISCTYVVWFWITKQCESVSPFNSHAPELAPIFYYRDKTRLQMF